MTDDGPGYTVQDALDSTATEIAAFVEDRLRAVRSATGMHVHGVRVDLVDACYRDEADQSVMGVTLECSGRSAM